MEEDAIRVGRDALEERREEKGKEERVVLENPVGNISFPPRPPSSLPPSLPTCPSPFFVASAWLAASLLYL